MEERLGTLWVFHANGHYDNSRRCGNQWIEVDVEGEQRFDMFQMNHTSIHKEIIHWNRVYVMQNGRQPIVPERILHWDCGVCKEIKFNKTVIKLVNVLLRVLPKKYRRRNKRWFGF